VPDGLIPSSVRPTRSGRGRKSRGAQARARRSG
jgi:hypothetical protein